MDSLTPSDLFSPSKARQQRAQAQDWAHIETWLSYKYNGRSIPTFERNDETLKALRELSMANERADEERIILQRVEREALKELDEVVANEEDELLLRKLKSSLTPEGEQALESLASTVVSLNTPDANAETIAHALIRHTTTTQNLTNQLAHIQTLQTYLTKQQSILRMQLNDIQTDPAFSPPSNIQRLTTEQSRQIKHLRTKIREHEDKLSSIQSNQSRTMTPGSKHIGSADAIAEMLEQQKALDELKEKVEGLEREVGEFAGLPADKESARKEVGRLEVKLDEARRKRDDLFEGLVGK